jgi:ankyrin repeat protein
MDSAVKLIQGVAFGQVESIREAHEEGADLDAELPDSDGRTPLTEAILGGMGEPEAVRALIELGADPGLPDGRGCTPWLACISRADDRVVAEEMAEIREILEQAGASTAQQGVFDLWDCARRGDLEGVRSLLEAGQGPVSRELCPLGAAVGAGHVEIAKMLLDHGAPVDGADVQDHGTSCLMTAARKGRFELVRLLVHHGADLDRAQPPDPEWTAARIAREAGHDAIADWLVEQGAAEVGGGIPPAAREGGPKAKYAALYQCGVDGANFNLDTDAIVDRLMQWDDRFGIDVVDVRSDGRFTVQFHRLESDFDAFAREIYAFCPDIVDQGFAEMAEAAERFGASGRGVPDDMKRLIEGFDPDDEAFGLKVLGRWLRTHRAVGLWWD